MAIDFTTGEFESGKGWVAFEEVDAAAGTQQLVSKDTTLGLQFFHIEKVILCCGTGGNVGILDGSGAAMTPFRLYGDVSVGSRSQGWDFAGDAMLLEDSDSTCLCITATGKFYGFIKYSLGS